MKRIFVLIITLASCSLLFNNCKEPEPEVIPPDVTSPVITVPNDTLFVDLGDKENVVLQGVKASDDVDGDITNRIKTNFTGEFNTLGHIQIEYSVSDVAGNKANNEKRDVIVKSGKLAGDYEIRFADKDGIGLTYNATISEQNDSALSIPNFHYLKGTSQFDKGWQVSFIGDGANKLKIVEREVPHDGAYYTISGNALFQIDNSGCKIVSMTYTLTPTAIGNPPQEYTATCTKQ